MLFPTTKSRDLMFETPTSRANTVNTHHSLILGLVATDCIAAVIIAVYLQSAWELYPCPLCILQRYFFIALGLFSLFSLLLKPGKLRDFSSAFCLLLALGGAAAAAWHVWILHHPAADCGRDAVGEFINGLPMAQWFPSVFYATGSCIDEIPPVLGMSFPVWALILFSLSALVLAASLLRRLRA
ncbi:MAG: disulfide bond formation protein B [Burkholderiaceae bacterium]|nr:disulfide bond formation protein B [Burkholderiaceae bacterium]